MRFVRHFEVLNKYTIFAVNKNANDYLLNSNHYLAMKNINFCFLYGCQGLRPLPTYFCCFLLAIFLLPTPHFAQEFRCTVLVNAQQVQTQEKAIIDGLQQNIQKFMNETRWTNEDVKPEERLKCTISLTLLTTEDPSRSTNVAQGSYLGTVQVQYTRPVYGSTYDTQVFDFLDQNFNFSYQPNQPLIFAENANANNLTAMLAYYAYTMLALDFDTFAEKGGSPFIEKMLNIANNSQQAGNGWDNRNNRNRYWLSENMNSPQFLLFREALYQYHRQGLDLFYKDAEEGRKKIAEAIAKIRAVNKLRPADALLIDIFVRAKRNEILQIFSQGKPELAKQVGDNMALIDPQNSNLYQVLVR